MDLDGDGILSMFELDYFYQEQVHKMEIYGIEYMPFEDCICQVRMNFLLTTMDTIKIT